MDIRNQLLKMANHLIEANLFNDRLAQYFEYCNQYDYLPSIDVIEKEVVKILKKN